MTTPDPTQRDARDAELEALRDAERGKRSAITRISGRLAIWEHTNEATALLSALGKAVEEYRDAVAARAVAELLQSGTPVWVATEAGDGYSHIHEEEQLMDSGVCVKCHETSALALHRYPPLTESGTCVEARVVLVPEGTHGR